MAYIKISDPNIIDLPTIHQIINVVNQHSDNISSLTNNFGSVYNSNPTSGATTQYQFDLASQHIMYGHTKVDADSGTYDNKGGYDITVPFTGQFFGNNPFVVVSVRNGATSSHTDVIARVTASSTSQVSLKVNKISKTGANGTWMGNASVYLDWIAIGSK